MTVNIRERTAQILSSRTISRFDQQLMSAMLGQRDLNDQDRTLIERVFYGVRHGLLKTVD
ncbi:hypothetical protein K4A83_19595 [Spirulina subsalsa FACHB-351]|uniref:Uncharacterized protein n=1 Tax=Spirulina subsalsa FACHB-351 TaxID=234711 RepID=A0ABT3LAC5_9CYAN|nr:hypothetical protein [Spirulina subsalsa]MCW6038459.1 hypothetical protein [Spirulina subsalsa FACHB-351]